MTVLQQKSVSQKQTFEVPEWFCDQAAWICEHLRSNSAVYNLPVCVKITGALDYDCLRRSLEEVQQRHQPLRSVFSLKDGRLFQTILPHAGVPLSIADFPAARATRWAEVAMEETNRPFDLTRSPAIRATLLGSAGEHVLYLTTHHLVCDDWSTGILLQELFNIYDSRIDERSSGLTNIEFSYSDFIDRQHRQLTGALLQSRLAFWTQQLQADSNFHHLSTDRTRPQSRTYRGQVRRVLVPEELRTGIVHFGQHERVSPFMILLAALQCILHRNSGDDDISIGSCAANRNLTQVERLIGRFANDLVIRTDLSGDPTFRELLARVRNSALTAYSNADVPFATLVKHLKHQFDPARNPLFQTMFIMQDAPKTLESGTLSVRRSLLDARTSKYDLCIFADVQNGLELAFEYNSDLFEPATIDRLSGELLAALQEMLRNPEQRIGAERLIGSAQRCTQCEARTAVDRAIEADEDQTASRLLQIWEAGFKRRISLDDHFFELGGDSLLAARLFAQIAEDFNVTIPIVALLSAPTVRQLVDLIRRSASGYSSQCAVQLQDGSGDPLFCVHGQSGNLLFYRTLAQHLNPRPVYGLQPVGIDGRHSPLESVQAMASTYVREVQRIQARGPYYLAGYCMGGNIALEMAQQLQGKGERVALVALIDSYNVGRMRRALSDDILFMTQKLWFGWRHLLRADSSTRRNLVKRRFEASSATPSELSESNRRAALSYVAAPYSGRVLHAAPQHQYARYLRRELRWNELIPRMSSLRLPIFPGEMFEEPHVRALAAELREHMERQR